MNSNERRAHAQLIDTASMRALPLADDPLEFTQRMTPADRRARVVESRVLSNDPPEPRERRKSETISERKFAAQVARDIFAERQQQMIEAGIWPVYSP